MSVESIFAKSSVQAAKYLGATILKTLQTKRLAGRIQHPIAQKKIAEFLGRLNPAMATELHGILESAQLDFLANQVLSWQVTGWNDDRRTELLHDIRRSLGRIAGMDPTDVWVGAEIILQSLTVVVAEATSRIGSGDIDRRKKRRVTVLDLAG